MNEKFYSRKYNSWILLDLNAKTPFKSVSEKNKRRKTKGNLMTEINLKTGEIRINGKTIEQILAEALKMKEDRRLSDDGV